MHQEALRFLKVLAGTGHPACVDLTCLNAGAILYLVGTAADIRSGIDAGRDIIHSGRALEKLSEWVSTQADSENSGMGRFADMAREAGIEKQLGFELRKPNRDGGVMEYRSTAVSRCKNNHFNPLPALQHSS